MFLEFALAIVIGLFVLDLYCHRWSRMAKLVNLIPGPSQVPFLGGFHHLFDILVNTENVWPIIKRFNKKYYPVWRLWFPGSYAIISLLHPDDIEVLLSSSKHIEKSFMYDFIEDWLKQGLLTSTGSKWRHRRKILTPAFHFNVLQKYAEVLIEHGTKLNDTLKAENGNIVVLEQLIPNITLSAICESTMGIKFETIDPMEIEKYREAVHFKGETQVYRTFRPWFYNDWIFYNFSKIGWRQKTVLKLLHDFSTKIIRDRKTYHEQTGGKFLKEITQPKDSNIFDTEALPRIKPKRLAMLDLLIVASNDGLIDEEGIREEVDTFIFEGHDTSGSGLCYILQLLAEYTEIQTRAREEVQQMFQSCGGNITMAEMNKLPFLERCIKESLRLYPSVPFIARQLREDLILKDRIIPNGSMINLYIYELHRDPRIWPEPNKFDPDRFLPERSLNRHPFSYIPFSAGSRNCIGQKFAMLELKVFCAYVLHSFYLQAIDKHEEFVPKPFLILRGQKQTRVKFIPIK